MSKIRTWAERLNDFPDMQITTSIDIQMAMQAEIDELREALQAKPVKPAGIDCGCVDQRDCTGKCMQAKPQHITDGTPCWCNPELDYVDPITGAEVWVHKEPQ